MKSKFFTITGIIIILVLLLVPLTVSGLTYTCQNNPIANPGFETGNFNGWNETITTVINYLRYYFCYHATIFADGMLTKYPDINTYIIQALASKLVLAKQFGIKFKNIFSTIQFNDDDVERVILIVKE